MVTKFPPQIIVTICWHLVDKRGITSSGDHFFARRFCFLNCFQWHTNEKLSGLWRGDEQDTHRLKTSVVLRTTWPLTRQAFLWCHNMVDQMDLDKLLMLVALIRPPVGFLDLLLCFWCIFELKRHLKARCAHYTFKSFSWCCGDTWTETPRVYPGSIFEATLIAWKKLNGEAAGGCETPSTTEETFSSLHWAEANFSPLLMEINGTIISVSVKR